MIRSRICTPSSALPSSQMSSSTRPGGRALDLAQRLVAVGGAARPVALVLEDRRRPPRGWRPRRRRSGRLCSSCLASDPALLRPAGTTAPIAAHSAARAAISCRATGKPSRTSAPPASPVEQLDRAAVFLHDLLDDGKAQARALGPGGDVGLEQALAIGSGKPWPLSSTSIMHRAVASRRTPDRNRATARGRCLPSDTALIAVLQQVGQRLRHLSGRRSSGTSCVRQARRCEPDLRPGRLLQQHRVADQLGRRFSSRKTGAGIRAKAENSLISRPMLSTWRTIVSVAGGERLAVLARSAAGTCASAARPTAGSGSAGS